MRDGRTKTWLWNGWVRDRRGALWGCTHDHWKQRDAKRCGEDFRRSLQLAIVSGVDVVPPAPVTLRPERGPIGDLTSAAWAAMKKQYGNRCHYCGEESRVLHKEHKIPLARGGPNNAANIVPACALCNLRKHVLTDAEFFEVLRIEKDRHERLGERLA